MFSITTVRSEIIFDGLYYFLDMTEQNQGSWDKVIAERQNTGWFGETGKARARRIKEGWFEKYAPEDNSGIDLGCQKDPLNHTFRRFDWVYGDGDATFMEGVPSDTFYTVYASHILEHLQHPRRALGRWYDILKPGGHLIVIVPHRDLYEKKRFPPSNWNPEHTFFWLPDKAEPPGTKCLKEEMLAAVPEANIVLYRTIDTGYNYSLSKKEHPVGEYSLEMIVQK